MNVARTIVVPALLFGCVSSTAAPALAGSGGAICEDKQQQVIGALVPTAIEKFGESVAVHGDVMVIGAPDKDAAYVLERVGGAWQHVAKLGPGGTFGISVATNGTQVFVGDDRLAKSGSGNPGAVKVYEKTGGTWTEVQTIFASDALDEDKFGFSLDVDGDRLVVGAPRFVAPSGTQYGAAYVYELEDGQWAEQAILAPSDATTLDHFGEDVAIAGDFVVVGAPGGGGAYVFERVLGIWSQMAKLVVGGPVDLGRRVAIDADTVVVASSQRCFAYEQAGPFWVQTQELKASFGPVLEISALAMDHGRLVWGLENDPLAGTGVGSLLVFERQGGSWVDRMKLLPDDAAQVDALGYAAAIHGGTLVAGAPESNVFASDGGMAFVFSAAPNAAPKYGSGCAGSGGKVPVLDVDLTYDGCVTHGTNLSMSVEEGLGGSFAVLLVGLSKASAGLAAGCELLLVPAGLVVVLPLQPSGMVPFGATVPAFATPGSLYMQAFVAEPLLPHGYAATNGLRLTIER